MNNLPNFKKNQLTTDIKNSFPKVKDEFAWVVHELIEKWEIETNTKDITLDYLLNIPYDEEDDSWAEALSYTDWLWEWVEWSRPKNWQNYREVFDSLEFKNIIWEIIIKNEKYQNFIKSFRMLFYFRDFEKLDNLKVIEYIQSYLFILENIDLIIEKLSKKSLDKLISPIRSQESINKYSDINTFIKTYLLEFIKYQILSLNKIKNNHWIDILSWYMLSDENFSPSQTNWDKEIIGKNSRLNKIVRDFLILEDPNLPNDHEVNSPKEDLLFFI